MEENLKIMNLIFFMNNDIKHEFPAPRTPKNNGIVERKNMSLQEMVRTMLKRNSMSRYFHGEAINSAYYVRTKFY